ncbi:hypothetical protein A0H81_03673 [Grifola frondosa]|uniref:Uncharacterized protein n=1 Tax=Grifola frondosa TaxID=5627 RepID=A0A1C7MJ62_GRIFR|nr:hypothetical protein A0H81_03673 [Grifola frondosa]
MEADREATLHAASKQLMSQKLAEEDDIDDPAPVSHAMISAIARNEMQHYVPIALLGTCLPYMNTYVSRVTSDLQELGSVIRV